MASAQVSAVMDANGRLQPCRRRHPYRGILYSNCGNSDAGLGRRASLPRMPSAAKNALEEASAVCGWRQLAAAIAEFPCWCPSAVGKNCGRPAVGCPWRGGMFTANICLRLEVSFDGDPLNAFCLAV